MSKEEHQSSDSDESDEDFCLEKELRTGNASVSEEDSDGDTEEEVVDAAAAEKTAKNVKPQKRARGGVRNQKTTARAAKRAKKSDKDDDTDDEDAAGSVKNGGNTIRSTRQTQNLDGKKNTHEKDELPSDEEDKSRTDALWADFLSDVKQPVPKRSNTNTPSSSSSSTSTKRTPTNAVGKAELTNGNESARKEPSKPETTEPKQITITETLDFAGEAVEVQRTVSVDSIKAKKLNKPITAATTPLGGKVGGGGAGGGLGSLVSQLGKKKKISVLEKSKLDWNSYVREEGIEEDLKTHNQGKGGYLDRQDFLQRTDVRQFEIERNLRQSNRKF